MDDAEHLGHDPAQRVHLLEAQSAPARDGLGEVAPGDVLGDQAALALPLHEGDHLHEVRVGDLGGGLEVARPAPAGGRRRRAARRAACASPRCVRRSCPRPERPRRAGRARSPRGARSAASGARRRARRAARARRRCGGRGCDGRGRSRRRRGGRRGRRPGEALDPLVHVAELQVLGLDLLEEGERLEGRPRRLVGEGQPVVEVEVRGRDRLGADRLLHPLQGQGGPAGLDEEPGQKLGGGAVVLVRRAPRAAAGRSPSRGPRPAPPPRRS